MRNSEGVVLWTHDVGSGLVTAATTTGRTERQREEGLQAPPKGDAGSDDGDTAEGADIEEVGIKSLKKSQNHSQAGGGHLSP